MNSHFDDQLPWKLNLTIYAPMNFEDLRLFITQNMKMTEVYQPLVIKTLLEKDGLASTRELAIAVLPYDQAQIEYYEQIMKRWPKITLTKHGVITYQRGGVFALTTDVSLLSSENRSELIQLCNEKIDAFLEAKMKRIAEEQTESPSYISGFVRYRVLSKAKDIVRFVGYTKMSVPLMLITSSQRTKAGQMT